MEDFTALAEELSEGIGDARGALILSRDGLVLGVHPADAEGRLKPLWLRFAALGEPESGFVQFGTEIWSYSRRGPYAAFVVTGTTVRPGLVIDRIAMALFAAEEARAKREGPRARPAPPQPVAAPTVKPRTPLHPEVPAAERPEISIHADVVRASGADPPRVIAPSPSKGVPRDLEPPAPLPPAPRGVPATSEERAAAGSANPRTPSVDPQPSAPGGPEGADDVRPSDDDVDGEVDRFALAREFSRLQEDPHDADGKPTRDRRT